MTPGTKHCSDILFACDERELNRERRGYFLAFQKRGLVRLASEKTAEKEGMSSGVSEFLEPILIYPDPSSSQVPDGLAACKFPTACFQIDTFSKPKWRALWSCLFDYVFVFHPGYQRYFHPYNHPRVILLPHAVHAADFAVSTGDRPYELGWVGSLDGEHYERRRRLLPSLAARYRMNAWDHRYPESEVAGVYRQSRIVVNIGRDDHPHDANIRCFEVMASGALLVTSLPSELEEMGFRNGVHFVGYSTENELFQFVDCFMKDEAARLRIVTAARDLVMREHTYDARVEKMLRVFEQDKGAMFAPARQWSAGRIDFVYLHYHCKHLNLHCARRRLQSLLRSSPVLAIGGLPLFLRCSQHRLLQRLKASKSSRAKGITCL